MTDCELHEFILNSPSTKFSSGEVWEYKLAHTRNCSLRSRKKLIIESKSSHNRKIIFSSMKIFSSPSHCACVYVIIEFKNTFRKFHLICAQAQLKYGSLSNFYIFCFISFFFESRDQERFVINLVWHFVAFLRYKNHRSHTYCQMHQRFKV
jgi:hypothetical protein